MRRLLTQDEKLIYTVRFHPLKNGWLLLGALASFIAAYFVLPVAALGIVLVGLWYLPLYTNEIAVTNNRLLLRVGWLKIVLEAIDDEKLMRWQLSQGIAESLVNAGTVTLRIREIASTREIVLPWISEPVIFLEALQAMQDEKYGPPRQA